MAADWYQQHGYEVLARGWRCREGEVDLILRRGRSVVFCEVKSRSSMRYGTPAEAVVPAKQARIRRLAARWLSLWTGPRPASVRFDVAAVHDGEVTVIEGAF